MDLREPEDVEDITAEEFAALGAAEGRRLTEDIIGQDLRGASLVECVLEGLSVLESDLTAVSVAESHVSRPNLPHLKAPRSGWRDVDIEGSRFGVAELYEASLSGVRLSVSKLDLINLRGADLSDVLIQDCTLGELDLTSATVARTALRGCRVETLVLSGSRCAGVDLTGAEVGRIVGLEGMRGVIVNPQQLMDLAPALAEQLGITVEG